MNQEQKLIYNELISKYNFNEEQKHEIVRFTGKFRCKLVCETRILLAKNERN